MERRGADGRFLLLCNCGKRATRVSVGASAPNRDYTRLCDSDEARFGGAGARLPGRLAATITLPPLCAVVYKCEEGFGA